VQRAARAAWDATSSAATPWEGDWRSHQVALNTLEEDLDRIVRTVALACREEHKARRTAARRAEILRLDAEIRENNARRWDNQ
jgi:hypothetical protein